MRKNRAKRYGTLQSLPKLVATAVLLLLPSCDPGQWFQRPVVPYDQADEVIVLSRNSPTTRYLGPDGEYVGFEQDLIDQFARRAGKRVRVIERSRFSAILPALYKRRAHIAAASISMTPEREKKFLFGPPYMTVRKAVVYNTALARPGSLKDLVGRRVATIAGSTSAAQLRAEAESVPELSWQEVQAADVDQLLEKLSAGDLDYVVSDSHVVELARNFYPNIAIGFLFGKPESLAWAMPPDAVPGLQDAVRSFFEEISADGTLHVLIDRYFGHVKRLDRGDIVAFLSRRETVLPQYKALFKEAQEITGIDWRLLAALGFQESHWNPMATSPTGVRGLMMMTSATADRMGVTDRLDAEQNIRAGARYLRMLKDTLPPRIPEPDRTWMALAAYNVGYGHLEDARIIAQRQGLNSDSWLDLRKTLPLLSRSDYYTTVKRGFARGGEAVILTENVRNYYDILQRFEEPHRPLFPELTGEPEP
jgi:membrane-bound lytic murein transglycosylase F